VGGNGGRKRGKIVARVKGQGKRLPEQPWPIPTPAEKRGGVSPGRAPKRGKKELFMEKKEKRRASPRFARGLRRAAENGKSRLRIKARVKGNRKGPVSEQQGGGKERKKKQRRRGREEASSGGAVEEGVSLTTPVPESAKKRL